MAEPIKRCRCGRLLAVLVTTGRTSKGSGTGVFDALKRDGVHAVAQGVVRRRGDNPTSAPAVHQAAQQFVDRSGLEPRIGGL